LNAVVMDMDVSGNTKTGFSDPVLVCESMDGTEIDGARFLFQQNGNLIDIVMEGDNLSEDINPNYPRRPLSPVSQISFRSAEGRQTANTLNKLIRRTMKEFPGKALLIRDVKELNE